MLKGHFSNKSLERLSSDFAISAAPVSIIISEGLFKYLWTICSSVHCTNAQMIRLSLHIRIVQAIVKKSTQPVIICKCEFIIAKADGAAKPSEVVSYSTQEVFFQSVYWFGVLRLYWPWMKWKICILEEILKLLILSCEFPSKHIPEEQIYMHFKFGGGGQVALNMFEPLAFFPEI